MHWFKEGKPLKAGKNLKFLQDGPSVSLNIPKCTKADAGEYTCAADNQAGGTFCTVSVVVEGWSLTSQVTIHIHFDILCLQALIETLNCFLLIETMEKLESDEERDLELIEKLSPKIAEEAEKFKDEDFDMLFKAYPMLGDHVDSVRGMTFDKGDIVEVLDTEKDDEWLVRKQDEKEKVSTKSIDLLKGTVGIINVYKGKTLVGRL